MKRWFGYGLLALAAYGAFLIAQYPAQSALILLGERVPGLGAARAQGTVLAGSASEVRFRDRVIDQLSWRWRPAGLLSGQLQYRLGASEPQLDVAAIAGLDHNRQLHLAEVSGYLPLARAITLAGRPAPPLGGRLELDLREVRLDLDGRPSALSGTVILRNAHTTFGRTLALGDFIVHFSTDARGGITGAIRDDGGPLEFTGTLRLSPEGRYRLSGRIGVRPDSDPSLSTVIALLGRAQEDGKWRFDLSGRWMS